MATKHQCRGKLKEWPLCICSLLAFYITVWMPSHDPEWSVKNNVKIRRQEGKLHVLAVNSYCATQSRTHNVTVFTTATLSKHIQQYC